MTTLRYGFDFRARKKLGAQVLTSEWRSNPERQDMKPAPINLAVDTAHKCAVWTPRDDAKAFDRSVAGVLNV